MKLMYEQVPGIPYPQPGIPIHSIEPTWIVAGPFDDSYAGAELGMIVAAMKAATYIRDALK